MEVKKLQENNELEKRAKQHGKKSKGLSSHCKLNPDAGNVEHNVAMFNHMSSPSGGPSTNPCGPMAEGLNEGAELIDLHYDKLKVTIVTRPARPASYYFEYDRDEAQTVEEYIEYDYTVKKSEVVDFICENMTENDFANIEDASDAELVAFVNEHFDDLYSKYEKMILEYFEDSAREHAEMQMSDDYLSEDTIQVNEKFIRSLGEDLNSLFATKTVDKNTAKEISKLEALYEKYNKIDDKRHVKAITEKVRYALRSCSDNKSGCLNESVDAEYVIMAIHNDGKKQYYNVSSVPHWVDKGQDATIFDDMDEARAVWFKLDKKPFKRVFIPNYDPEKMNEAVDADKLYAQDMMIDRIDDLFDFAMKGYFSRFIQPYVYRVYNRNKQASVVVKFDIDNPQDKFSFSVDGKHHTANTESDAAKIIQNAVDSKYSSSFDIALEDLSDRIRKDDLEYDDSIDAWTASEGDTQIQFQDREQHTHEFKTKTNQWGRNFIDGQYNKQPKVASHTWGRVWKDGELVKQAEGPKYQVRAEIAKYLDAEGNIDEAWTPPEDWMSYKGAWIYPVEGGYEANFTGEHFEAATLDELKAKLQAARVHRQKFSGYSERDAELADKIKSFGRELQEDTDIELSGDTQEVYNKITDGTYKPYESTVKVKQRNNIVTIEACYPLNLEALKTGKLNTKNVPSADIHLIKHNMEMLSKSGVMSGPSSRETFEAACAVIKSSLNVPADAKCSVYATNNGQYDKMSVRVELTVDTVAEGWNPDLVDCPACGDLSFDSRRGRCTQCSYRESLNENLYNVTFFMDSLDDDVMSGPKTTKQIYASSPEEAEKKLVASSTSKYYIPSVIKIEEVGSLDESVEYVKWVQMPDGEWKMWGSNPDDKLDPTFLDRARKRNNIEYLDAKVVKNGESPVEEAVETTPTEETLDEASYGGAFDIADDQYFTRDDLVDCAEKVIEHLNETFEDVFELYNVELNGVTLQIEVEGKKLGWYMEKCRIDMRKIRVPSDLTNKYALEFASKFIATIKDYNNI